MDMGRMGRMGVSNRARTGKKKGGEEEESSSSQVGTVDSYSCQLPGAVDWLLQA